MLLIAENIVIMGQCYTKIHQLSQVLSFRALMSSRHIRISAAAYYFFKWDSSY